MDGLLVHGENFQALNLLQVRYRGRVKCVYIDPPYNTASSSILYKNDHKDSSWMSLLENRLELARRMLADDGMLCCAIDDEEAWRLRALLLRMFERDIGVTPIRSTPVGRTSRGKLSPTHEYAFFHGRENAVPGSLLKTERENQRYPYSDEHGRYAWRNLLRTGVGDTRVDRPTLFYPIYVDDNDVLRVPRLEWDEASQEYEVLEAPRENETVVLPVREQDGEVVEKRWEHGRERVSARIGEYRAQRNGSASAGQSVSIHFIQRMDESSVPKTWWGDAKYASSNHGAMVLKNLFVENPFDFPKSVALVEDCIRTAGGGEQDAQVVDFFAGSGTTGHAIVNLNRDDGGRRRYLLVEVGRHFETIVLPRMKKIVHSRNWKQGRPVSRDGVSHVLKYVRLESYEDAMDSLEVAPSPDEREGLLAENPELAEDYRLRYALGAETSGSACLLGKEFTDPFAYRLSVVRDGVRRDVQVDLPETFNWLIGLRVESRRRIEDVLAITGADAQGRQCLALWRNVDEIDAAALDAWFDRNRKAGRGRTRSRIRQR